MLRLEMRLRPAFIPCARRNDAYHNAMLPARPERGTHSRDTSNLGAMSSRTSV